MSPYPMVNNLTYMDKVYLVYGVFGRNDKHFIECAKRASDHNSEILGEFSGAREMLEILEGKLYENKVVVERDGDMWKATLEDIVSYGTTYPQCVYFVAKEIMGKGAKNE